MKDKGILTLKGMAIIGVVIHHVRNPYFAASVREILENLTSIFSWCVLAFFAASGWLHALSMERKNQALWAFIKSRALRLLLPFSILVLLYAVIYQLIQIMGIPMRSTSIPLGFGDKIIASMPPTDGREVALQLYFLPLLFIVVSLFQIIITFFGQRGIFILCAVSLGIGIAMFPNCKNTGFSLGVGFWGTFSYTAGFIMYGFRANRWLLPIVLGFATILSCTIGISAIAKTVSLLLLGLMKPLRFDAAPLLPAIGEASATTYAYHTPFILMPLVKMATKLPSPALQTLGALGACLVTIFLCTLLFFQTRKTRLKFIIL